MFPRKNSPASAAPGAALAVLLAMGLGPLAACGELGEVLGPPAPTVEELPAVLEPHAASLTRLSCAGCPERWEPASCEFTESLLRGEGLQASHCAVVQTGTGRNAVPERLLPLARRHINDAREDLDRTRNPVDGALALYAFGSDLQRLGSLDSWKLGLEARAQALAVLSEQKGEGRWTAELLALESVAPAPARAADVAVLDTAARLVNPERSQRQAILMGSRAAREALRVRPEQRASAMRDVRQGLSAALPQGRTELDLVEAWEGAEYVRERSIGIALDAALAARRSCPASLDELVPAVIHRVPDGWQLDGTACRARLTVDPTAEAAPPLPAQGALAAPR
ncbi:MAG: hypothetical protein H6742_07430 [Alphaproteobacteria bacterium]|nr:hypothetical protein [Alphaproteobacteria bacterium]